MQSSLYRFPHHRSKYCIFLFSHFGCWIKQLCNWNFVPTLNFLPLTPCHFQTKTGSTEPVQHFGHRKAWWDVNCTVHWSISISYLNSFCVIIYYKDTEMKSVVLFNKTSIHLTFQSWNDFATSSLCQESLELASASCFPAFSRRCILRARIICGHVFCSDRWNGRSLQRGFDPVLGLGCPPLLHRGALG